MRDFLVLPELKLKEENSENELFILNENVAISVINGKFNWGPPPEVPMSETEVQQIEMEKRKREMEGKEKNRGKNSSDSIFSKQRFPKASDSSVSNVLSNIITTPGKDPSTNAESREEDLNSPTIKNSTVLPSTTPSLSPFPITSPSSDRNKSTLNNINVEIFKGGLTMIIGLFFFFIFLLYNVYLLYYRRCWKWEIQFWKCIDR
jgi:hypothetical protein